MVLEVGKVRFLAYGIAVFAALLSFRSFLAISYPELNSDHAIHILMSANLRLPDDLYYWGQARLGSFVPIISSLLIKFFSVSPAAAVSTVQCAISIVGFLCFTSLLRSIFAKVIFSAIWFLPLSFFSELVQPTHPYASQLTFTGIAIVLCLKFLEKPHLSLLKKHLLLTFGILSFFVSLWISELSIVNVGFIIFIAILYRSTKLQESSSLTFIFEKIKKLPDRSSYLINFLSFFAFGGAFLAYAKIAVQDNQAMSFRSVNTLTELLHVVKEICKAILRIISFESGNWLISVYGLLTLCIILFILIKWLIDKKQINKRLGFREKFLILFFSWHSLATLGLLAVSHWVYLNAVHPRYFTNVYISFWLVVLIILEGFEKNSRHVAYSLVAIAAIIASLTLPSYVFSVEQPFSKIQQLQEVESLGQAGLIGDYWHSYIVCAANPEHLSCTPHDGSYVRCSRCVSQALSAPNLYLVKEGWLESFPDQLIQFDALLERQGEEKHIAGYTLAPYQVIN